MIQITKDEAMAIRAKYGDEIGITITNRNKKGGRKHYYTEDTSRVFFFLERFRNRQARNLNNSSKKRGS